VISCLWPSSDLSPGKSPRVCAAYKTSNNNNTNTFFAENKLSLKPIKVLYLVLTGQRKTAKR